MVSHTQSIDTPVSRRRFLAWSWLAAGTALFLEVLWMLLVFFKPESKGFGGKITAGAPNEFPAGSITHIRQGRFYMVNVDGGFLALSHRCTHLGCTVPWKEEEKQFVCPCHGSVFDIRGNVLTGPAPRAFDLFPIEVVQNRLVVQTSAPIQRQQFEPTQLVRV